MPAWPVRPSPCGPRGCAFVQFGCSLAALALPAPRDCSGRPLEPGERGAMIHFVSADEFAAEVAPSDPKLGALAEAVSGAIERHDDRQEVVVVGRGATGALVPLRPRSPRPLLADLPFSFHRRRGILLNRDAQVDPPS